MCRPIPSGRVGKLNAYIYFFIQLCAAFVIWLYLPNVLKIMTFVELILICIYPFFKRFLYLSQVYLGIIAALPMAFPYYLFEQKTSLSMLLLVVAGAIICIIFDTFFEYSEYFHNKNIKAKSVAIIIGCNPKKFFYICSILCLTCLLLAGYLSHRRLSYYVISSLAIFMLCTIVRGTDIKDQEQCLRSFLSLQLINLIILFGIYISNYV